jgi:ligand-binding sensor domain-containing protein
LKRYLQSLKWALVVGWLLGALPTDAQSPAFRRHEPGGAFSDLQIHIAAEDCKGYLWLGTSEGLLRFDGIRFERPAASNIPQLNGKPSALYCDSKGIFWVGFRDGSIAYTDQQGQWRLWELEEGLPAAPVTGFAESADGLFWIATYGEGLYYYNGKHLNNLSEDEGLPGNDIYTLAETGGRIWAGTDGGIAVCSIQEGRKTVSMLSTAQGLPDPIVTVLLPDGNGNIWVGMHDGGFAHYNVAAAAFFCPEIQWEHGVVTALALLKGRELWIGTDGGGLYRYGLFGGQLDKMNGADGLARAKISGLRIGQEGQLWVMTNERGFYSANLQFAAIHGPQGSVQAVLAGSRNRLWAGTPSGLWFCDLLQPAPRRFTPLPHPAGKPLNIISLYEDDHGNIWIGTFGQGLYILPAAGGSWIYFDEKSGLTNNSILHITGHGKHVWLATLGGVTEFELRDDIARHAPAAVRNYQQESGLGSNFIYSVFADSRGRIWFGTDGKGLSVAEGGSITNYNQAVMADRDTLPLHAVYSIAEDNTGRLWFTTAKDGLFSFDGQLFRRHNYPDGVRNKGIALIYKDVSGLLLLAHRNGIDLLDPATGRFSHFEESAGITDFEPNLNAVSGDRQGHIWMGTQQGVMRYSALGRRWADYPKTIIERVFVFLEPVDFQNKTTFGHRQNSLVFRFSGLWYTDPERIQYRYRLRGYNHDWIYSADRQATYSNLPPGKYTFEVSAGLDEHFELGRAAHYTFYIRAPFWLRWWFILLTAAGISGAILYWIRFREMRLQREALRNKEQIENRFEVLKSQINPHFLFNSFNTLASIIEEDPTLAVRYVERLSDFFRSIIQYREKDLIPLAEELELVKNYAFLLEQRYGQNFRLDIREDTLKEGFIAPLSLQLLVENAVKHNIASAAKPLHAAIYGQNGYIMVENTLQPRLSPAESTGMGLKNIVRRYELLSSSGVTVEKTAALFRVGIPIIQIEPL